MQHIAHLESLQQGPVSFTELPQDACLLNPLLVRHSHSSCGHFASDRCEMALLLKGCSLLHMSSFFRQGQLPLLR